MVGDEHTDAALLEMGDDALDLADRDRIDAGEGFVEQDQARLGGQGTGDLAAAAFTAGQAGAELVGHVAQLQFVEQATEFALAAGRIQVVAQLQHQAQVVGHGQLAEHRRFLRQVAHALLGARVHRVAGDVLAVQHDAAGIGFDQAHDHVEAGGLAGAVGAEQADHFTGIEGQPEVLDDFALLVLLAQALGDKHYFLLPAAGAAGVLFLGGMTVRTRLPSPPEFISPVRVL